MRQNRRQAQRILIGSGVLFLVAALALLALGKPTLYWGVALFAAVWDFVWAIIFSRR